MLTKNYVDRDQVAHFKVNLFVAWTNQLIVIQIMSAMVFVPIFYTIMGAIIWKTIGLAFVFPTLAVTFLSGYMV